MPLSEPNFLLCRVPEDCPQGVEDLRQACIAANPSMRPSAANMEAALRRLHSMPQPPPSLPAEAAPDPHTAANADPNAPQAVERGAGASRSGDKLAGAVAEGGAGALGAAAAEQLMNGQHAGGGHVEVQPAAVGAAGSRASEPDQPGAAGEVTRAGGPKRQEADCARTDSPVSPLDISQSE